MLHPGISRISATQNRYAPENTLLAPKVLAVGRYYYNIDPEGDLC